MKNKSLACIIIACVLQSVSSNVFSQRYEYRIVNMLPADRSSDTSHDGEPNIAVNPANPQIIAASAFTFSANRQWCDTFPCLRIPGTPFPNCKAPIYVSMDGGNTWELKEVVPSNNGITHDITVAFSDSGYLYVAALKGCQYSPAVSPNNMMKGFFILRSPSVLRTGDTLANLVRLDQRFGIVHDQPWVEAITSIDTVSDRVVSADRVFVAVNKQADAISSPVRDLTYEGRTARLLVGGQAEVSPAVFNPVVIETERNNDKNPSAVRVAVHRSGKVYAIFLRTIPGVPRPSISSDACRVVVVRDDSFALKSEKFNALGIAGQIVADNQVTTYHSIGDDGWLGRCRVGGSNLAIAVDPVNDQHVFIAWCSMNAERVYTLYFSQSWDGGRTWSSEHLPTVPRAMNPAIAITNDGRVGLLYQQMTTDVRGVQWWETHFIMKQWNRNRVLVAAAETNSSAGNDVLSRFRDDELPERIVQTGRPPIGDYIDLVAVNNIFYGVFSAVNTPNNTIRDERHNWRFPTVDPVYNRLLNSSGQLINLTGNLIRSSVDPFFFKIEPR
jgi:hypothetical protein